MADSTNKKTGKRKAELRVRMRALLEDGSMAALRSEGRLVALYVLQVADWTSCQARFSIRRAAATLRVHPNTVHRGVKQLIDGGVLEALDKGGRGFYQVKKRTPLVDTASTARVQERPPLVDSAPTARVRAVHELCARRTPLVGALSTGCGQDSVLSSGSPVRTSEITSETTAKAGQGPARPRLTGREGNIPQANSFAREAPAFDPSGTITQEVDT
jgi:hypothetical protein